MKWIANADLPLTPLSISCPCPWNVAQPTLAHRTSIPRSSSRCVSGRLIQSNQVNLQKSEFTQEYHCTRGWSGFSEGQRYVVSGWNIWWQLVRGSLLSTCSLLISLDIIYCRCCCFTNFWNECLINLFSFFLIYSYKAIHFLLSTILA